MKWMIPTQHGAWSMLILPFVLGGTAGGWRWTHIPFAIAWLFVYMGTFFYSNTSNSERNRVSFYAQ
ncbi:YwiC-like family protein [Exiguobacterium aestuarii]|uniref:YwiC-like family protein n=1 Tax=Exiguobacterium aestuarii TaxID=273527 RepID=UPI00296E5448|nr:YwiC-like family protein [Exiguobacterium aestuarii]